MEAHRRVRKFGFMPDEANLLPGDLLLVSVIGPRHYTANIIRSVQHRGGCSLNTAEWHHAAMYIGDGDVLEAVPFWGVRVSKLYKYTGRHKLLFRRHPNLTLDQRQQLCIKGMRFLTQRYSWAALLQVLGHSFTGFWNNIFLPFARRAHICSQIYSDSYLVVTNDILLPGHLGYVLPAHLRYAKKLVDVNVGWVKIT